MELPLSRKILQVNKNEAEKQPSIGVDKDLKADPNSYGLSTPDRPAVISEDSMQFINITTPSDMHSRTNKRRVRSQAMRSFRAASRRSAALRPTLIPGHIRPSIRPASTKAAAFPSRGIGLPPRHGIWEPDPAAALIPGYVDLSVDFQMDILGYSHSETLSDLRQVSGLESNQDIPAPDSDKESRGQLGQRRQTPESENIISFWEVANLNPFDTYPATIRKSEQALMHHWIYVFGSMMFGKPRYMINPMAEFWIPDALSNEASFQGMLSYAAAHLAHLRGQKGSTQGTMYNIKAIALIQNQLNDSATALRDSTVSAILRQISIEDRFGSVEIARLHRAGLDKIIEKRGGLSSFRQNLSIELLLHWYLITSKPTFHFHSLVGQEVSIDSARVIRCKEAIRLRQPRQLPGLLAKFIHFFNELKAVAIHEIRVQRAQPFSIGLGAGITNRLLYLFAEAAGPSRGATHDIIEETCRLASLFYMAAVKADILRRGTCNLGSLKKTLRETQSAWNHSLEMLLWVLLKGNGPGLENPKVIQLVLSLMEVAKMLHKESWNLVKEVLIDFLWGDVQKVIDIDEESFLFMTDLIETRN